MFDVATVIHQI